MNKRHLLFSSLALVCGLTVTVNHLTNSPEKKYNPRQSDEKIVSEGSKGAIEYMLRLKADPQTGEINPKDVINARKAAHAMSNSSKALNLQWSDLGPDNVGGRTRTILIDRNNPNRMYAAGVAGGIWYSNNAGTTWYRQDNNGVEMNNAVVSLAQDANGDIYAGTGEGMFYTADGNKSRGILGRGVYKSTDGGNTFEFLDSTTPNVENASGATWSSVGKLACDPNIAGRVYASTNKGFKISNDGGLTWINETLDNTNTLGSSDVEVGSDGSVYAQYGSRIYYSPNGNSGTFTRISNGIPTASGGRMEIAVAPSDPSTLYVITSNNSSHTGIYVSYDRGANWETLAGGSGLNFNPLGGQAGYDLALAVYPNNKDRIIFGGVQLWGWRKGENFLRIGSEFNFPGNPYYVHADKHTVVFHPNNPNILYIGSDGGIGYSADGGNTFSTKNFGYSVTQYYTLDVTKSGHPFGGTQDNSCPFVDGNGATPRAARIVGRGDGTAVGASKLNDKYLYYSSQHGNAMRSSNGGESGSTMWSSIMTNTELKHPDLVGTPGDGYNFANFVNQIALWENPDSLELHIVVAALENGIWVCKNLWDFSADPVWQRVSSRSSAFAQSIAISNDGDIAYIGYSGSLVRLNNLNTVVDSLTGNFRSDQSLVEEDVIWTGSRLVTDIAVNPNDANDIVITMGGYGSNSGPNVLRSSDALSANPVFDTLQGNLPHMPVYSAQIVEDQPEVVLLGTEHGVFATENGYDAEPTWVQEITGLDDVPVFELYQQRMGHKGGAAGEIFAATHGRGFFKTKHFISIPEITSNDGGDQTLNIYPNPVVANANISLELNESADVSVMVYDVSGKMVLQRGYGKLAQGMQTVSLEVASLPAGVYITQVHIDNKMISGKMMVSNK